VFAIKGDTLVSRHDVKDDVTAALGVGDGNAWVWHLSANAMLSSPFKNRASVYTIGGLGVYYRNVNLTNPGVGFVTVCDPWLFVCYDTPVATDKIVGERSSTDFGMNIGGGVNFKVGETSMLFIEFRYHYIWGPKPDIAVNPLTGANTGNVNTQMMPITFGVRF
jgi:opacity protein-like surface antigen